MDDLLDDFLAETHENLDALTNDLLAWEKTPADRSLLDGVFRFFHTIKGNSGFLDFKRLGRLSHAAETALARARDGGVVPDGWFVSTICAAIDEIRNVLAVLAETRIEPDGNDADLIGRLDAAAIADCRAADSPEDTGDGSGPATKSPVADARKTQASSVRVAVGLLDRLMGVASELVLARNALLRSVRQGEEISANLIEHISACVTDLQDGINRTRMQPIEALWTPLPRLVRDLARELSKDLELVLEGGDTELDRQLLEAIRDPISHMMRNAADHGIESPEVRRRMGKSATGTIRLAARQSGGHIFIEMSDDGRGIDPDRLRARAITMGLMSPAETDSLSDAAAQALIFEPGLSTATTVTAISGRGVGMDVVRNNLERIGGSVEVRSHPGHGTKFTIRVPLTLTIVPALIVGLGGRAYAIGQSSICEIVRLKNASLMTEVGGRPMLILRDVLMPVVDLAELFGNAEAETERWGVVVEVGGIGRVALFIDAVHDQEEIVIRPVSPLLGAAGVYSGATVLGTGEAALVLDLAGIVARAGILAGAAVADANPNSADRIADVNASWMLFEAAGVALKAIPLALVARIESLDPAAISFAGGRWMFRHDGQLLPLSMFTAEPPEGRGGDLVLILDDGHRRVAVPVSRVADIISHAVNIEQPAAMRGIAGLAVIDGQSIEIVDTGWLMGDSGPAASAAVRGSILIIGNRQFAGGVLKPLLESVGHATTIVADDAEAEALATRGLTFDLVLADGETSLPQGLSPATIRFGDGTAGSRHGERVDPYDRETLLDTINGSLRRRSGAAK